MSHECLYCGACCFSDSDAYIDVDKHDAARLSDASLVANVEGRTYMKMEGGHCAALTFLGTRFVCSVYARRPQACRDLDRGSPECFEERTLKRARALRVLNGPQSGHR